MSIPRGIRNRNPGNIDYNPNNQWQGLADPPSDGRFCIFREDQFGIRALCRLLMTYQKKHGCDTVRKVINRWAPPNENNTGAYVNAVASSIGCGADDKVDVYDREILERMVRAIVRHENGPGPFEGDWYTNAVYQLGIQMATGPTQSKTIQGSVLAGSATAAGVVIETVQTYLPQAIDAGNTVSTIWPEVAKYMVALLTFAGLLLILYSKLEKREEGLR